MTAPAMYQRSVLLAPVKPVIHARSEVEKALGAYAPHMRRVCLDNRYYCLTGPDWDALIKAVGPEHRKYAVDKFDCDAFSRVWYGRVAEDYEINGMGIVIDWSGQHSYNLLLVSDGEKPATRLTCRLFEPQNLSEPKRGAEPYLLKSGILFF